MMKTFEAAPAPPRARQSAYTVWRTALSIVIAGVALVHCTSDKKPTEVQGPQPGLHFIAGRSGADTIEAVLPTRLIAEFRDDSGNPLPNRRVVFIAGDVALTIDSATSSPQNSFAVTTDANGRISAQVRLGKVVGTTTVLAAIPGTGTDHPLNDTATFVVRAGNPARVTLEPRDTALYPGARLVLRQTVRDRLGNSTTGTIPTTYTASNGLTVSSTGVATPLTPQRAFIVAHTGAYSDSIALTVLPITGTLAASIPSFTALGLGVAVMNLDGSGYQEFAKTLAPIVDYSALIPRWNYDGKSLVVRVALRTDERLWVVPTDGSAPRRLMPNSTFTSETSPAPSQDGQWVYFCGDPAGAPFQPLIHRVHLDGSGLQLLPLATPALGDELCGSTDISALGDYIAWAVPGDGRMKTRSVGTGVRTAFNREGIWPAWAPSGTRLAYIKGNPGPIYTAELDGSDDRLVASGVFNGPLSWSSDGKFILAPRATTSRYELIDVATGATYVLPFAIGPYAVLKPAVK